MSDLWDILDRIDTLTKTLAHEGVLEEWAGLSREERLSAVMRLREVYLRLGNVLEEWRDVQTSEGRR